MIRIIVGDCREVMRSLPAASVQCVATSPPFYGLREYGIAPSLWGGDLACDHSWGEPQRTAWANSVPGEAGGRGDKNVNYRNATKETGSFCVKCGCWRGVLGMEPDFREFVAHVVEVFREVRRVLRPDGVAWLNLGDSYATGAGKVGDRPGGGAQGDSWAGYRGDRNGHEGKQAYMGERGIGPMTSPNRMPQPGLKPKDLMLIPSRVAIALCDDGWWIRQDIIWHKPRPMPESVLDRCTKSHEYVFLLAKSERYFYDAEAIAEPITQSTIDRVSQPGFDEQLGSDRVPGKTNSPIKAAVKRSGNKERKPASARGVPVDTDGKTGCAVAGSIPWEGTTRNKRDVWSINPRSFFGEFCRACRTYFEGDALNALREEVVECGGRRERRRWCSCGRCDAWLSHFATFPADLVGPMIEAGTSERGCCVRCGAPWEREIERIDQGFDGSQYGEAAIEAAGGAKTGGTARSTLGSPNGKLVGQRETVGWRPTCECSQTALGRCVVLDPFGGARSSGRARCLMLLDRTTDARTPLPGRVLAVVKHLGIHCGAGGQVVLHYWQREAAADAIRAGFVEMWFRRVAGQGATGPYYGLTDRGRRLAASLLTRPQPRRRSTVPAVTTAPPSGAAQRKEKFDAGAQVRPQGGASVPGRHRNHPDAVDDRDRDEL